MPKFTRRFTFPTDDRSTDSTVCAARFVHSDSRGEQPGPDGIRWGLVERVRAEIAAGTYDTEDKWAKAEQRLIDRLVNRI